MRNGQYRFLMALLLGSILIPLMAWDASALYMWKDEKGVTHITEYPDPRTTDDITEKLQYRGGQPEAPATPPRPPVEPETLQPVPERPALRYATPEGERPRPFSGKTGAAPPPSSSAAPFQQSAPPEAQQGGQFPQTSPLSPTEQKELEEAFKQVPGAPPGFQLDDRQAAGAVALILTLLSGFLVVFIVIGIGMYIFFSLCLFLIAKKLDVENPWIAWIPLAQTWTFVQCAGKPWWWLLLLWLGMLIFAPVGIVVGAILWVSITENLGLNKWLGLLMLLPLVQLGFMGYLAFSKNVAPGGPALATEFGDLEGFPPEDELPDEEGQPYGEGEPYGGMPDLPPEEPYEEQYEDREPPPIPD